MYVSSNQSDSLESVPLSKQVLISHLLRVPSSAVALGGPLACPILSNNAQRYVRVYIRHHNYTIVHDACACARPTIEHVPKDVPYKCTLGWSAAAVTETSIRARGPDCMPTELLPASGSRLYHVTHHVATEQELPSAACKCRSDQLGSLLQPCMSSFHHQ